MVLFDDHQGGGGGRSGCNGAQRDGGGHGDDVRAEKVQDDQCHIREAGGHHGLQDAHRDGLFAHALKGRQAEFVADDKGDKAQRHLRDDAVALDLYDAPEADAPAAQAKLAQKEGPQQQTRHQIGGDGG